MRLSNKKSQNFTVIEIVGRIDTTNYTDFEKEVIDAIEGGETNIVINCSGLDYISSSGLRIFLIAQKKMNSVKGKLHLCNVQPSIKEIFNISGLSRIFKIFGTESEALGEA